MIESIRLYISKMSLSATHRVQSIIAANDTAVHFTSAMPQNSAADSFIFSLTQFKDELPSNVISCMVVQPLPTADIWKDAYDEDEKTKFIMQLLQPNSEFSEKGLRVLHASYRHPLREH